MALPGIGRSTAGAILALSRGQRQPISGWQCEAGAGAGVRHRRGPGFGRGGRARLWAQAEACTPTQQRRRVYPSHHGFGCDLVHARESGVHGVPDEYGLRRGARGTAGGAARTQGETAPWIARGHVADRGNATTRDRWRCWWNAAPMSGLWGGLWSPPQFESEFAALDWCRREMGEPEVESRAMAPIHHAFTHFDLRLNPLRVRCRPQASVHDGDDRLWYRLGSPPRVGLPQPILKLFERLRSAQGG